MRQPRFFSLLLSLVVLTLSLASPSHAQTVTDQEAYEIGMDAYVYGYPLVTMEYTRRVMTNVAAPKGTHAPMGQFTRMRTYPTAAFRDVTAPNADTLYTVAWFDLSKEPWVVQFPDMKGRYFLMPMLDAWTTVFDVPGKRTSGTGAQTYVLTGPSWKGGALPKGARQIKSPTSLVWLLGRIYCSGTPADYAAVHAVQDGCRACPLSAWGRKWTPPAATVDPKIDMKTPVRAQVNNLDGVAYFKLMARLMKNNPPTAEDAPMVERMARIGLVPGQDFNPTPEVAKALARVPKPGFANIMGQFKQAGEDVNGWVFTTKTGIYGTDYLQRALVTAIGLGANRPQDAIYPTSTVDAAGKPYNGANKYVMHFAKGQLPPVNGFWSLTMYDAGYFFVANPLNRYTVSSRTPFKTNSDGSIDVYIQHASPGKAKESNWLPAPAGKFILMLRFYWPKSAIIDGTWKMPPVKQV